MVVEAYLDGPEVSLFAITDGTTVRPMQPAQDFKRVGDGDTGPNTGGMGAYTPLPWAPADLVEEVTATVLQPTVDELARRGTPFAGLLYAGLALTARGIRVVEFNARFGDPETQPLLARLETPLGGLLYAAATGSLAGRARAGVAAGVGGRRGAGGGELSRDAGHRRGDHRARRGRPTAGVVVQAGTADDADGRVVSSRRPGADRGRHRRRPRPRPAQAAYAGIGQIGLDGSFYRTTSPRRRPVDGSRER